MFFCDVISCEEMINPREDSHFVLHGHPTEQPLNSEDKTF